MGIGALIPAKDGLRKAVFLDRDGVLNKAVVRDGKPYPPADVAALEISEDAPAALARLKQAGFRLIVVTNQPDVARGTTPLSTVQAINDTLCRHLPLDAVEVCLHDEADCCACRKPAPGMLLAAGARDGIDMEASYMVGDRWRDVEAGKRAGCTTVLVGGGYAEGLKSPPHVAVATLAEAADWIIGREAHTGLRARAALGEPG